MASYPALEDWFSTSIRRNRKSFILATLALTAVMIVIALVIGWFASTERGFFLVFVPFLLAYAICTYMLTAQRLRDIGLTGWLSLLWVPVNMADTYLHGAASLATWIVLCSVPGTQGTNRYGPDPLGSDGAQRDVASNTAKNPKEGTDPEVEAIFAKLHNFLLDERAQIERLPQELQKRINANLPCDSVPKAEGPFGKCITNPIPANGPLGQVLYLSALRINRSPVLFHRLGSFSEIDIFEIASIDGVVWDILFMSLYFPRRSRKAPQGYSLDESAITSAQFFGTTTRVEPFPHDLYDAIRTFSINWIGLPLPNRLVREAISSVKFAPPETHRLRVNEFVRSKMQLSLTHRDVT